ncbi:mitotic spindle assembly checkpoint protein MAD1-like isoform X1 [Ictidomys tridecemlineatus]
MKSELLRLPRMERELKRLREDNAHLREMRETNGLLTEELEGLQRRLGRQEKMQETLVDLELEKERLLAKLQSWENLDHTMGLDLRTPEDLSRFVVELQQRELALKEKNSAIASSARGLEKAQQQLQEEVRQVSSRLLEERKKRETHEALARRLQKRVLLLTKERDGMRAILGSYDSEMTQAEYSPQLTRRVREAEDMVQKVHAHSTEMEAQLTQALEELGGQKQRADMLEMELKMLKSQPGSAESSFPFCREEVDTLRANVSTRVHMLSLNPGAQTGLQKDPTSEGAVYTLNSVMLQSWNHSVEAALGTLNLILPGLVAWVRSCFAQLGSFLSPATTRGASDPLQRAVLLSGLLGGSGAFDAFRLSVFSTYIGLIGGDPFIRQRASVFGVFPEMIKRSPGGLTLQDWCPKRDSHVRAQEGMSTEGPQRKPAKP